MTKKLNTSSVSGKRSQPQSLKNTGQTQRTTETSPTLLPTPSSRDWKGASKTKPRDTLDSAVENGATKHKTGLFSPEVSPANHSATLDEEKERQMTATSGLKCLQSYKTSDQIGSSLRTCVASLLGTTAWFSNARALTWKAKITKSNRLLFQLAPSKRRTSESECGLLHTPRTLMIEETPENFRRRMNSKRKNDRKNGLPNLAVQMSSGHGTGEELRLQPAMTEWMMGFPDGWTELPSVPPDTAKNA